MGTTLNASAPGAVRFPQAESRVMPMQEITQRWSGIPDPRQLERDRIWNEEATLRFLYSDYHRRLIAACPDGPLLDIGGGKAHVKEVRSDVCSVDILPFPGIDVVCDAHSLAFPDGQFAGIMMIDVLHHLQRPIAFLKEASRVLRPRGVLAMIEPSMSPIVYPFCGHLHQEPADMRVDPFPGPAKSSRDPFDANQAIPTFLFDPANRPRLNEAVPELRVLQVDWLSLFAFPLSGGFKSWCLMPSRLATAPVRFEDKLPTRVRQFFWFRIFAALQKVA
jgi:SAM-dependent methyltransferase